MLLVRRRSPSESCPPRPVSVAPGAVPLPSAPVRSLRRPQSVCLALIICHVDYLALKKKENSILKRRVPMARRCPGLGKAPGPLSSRRGPPPLTASPPPKSCRVIPSPPVWGLLGWEGGSGQPKAPRGRQAGGRDPAVGQDHRSSQRAGEQQAAAGALVGAA